MIAGSLLLDRFYAMPAFCTESRHVNACTNVPLQIRNVPGEVRDRIAALAAKDGKSLQSYLLDLVHREVRTSRRSSFPQPKLRNA